jgi:hypothetical protein
LKIGDSQHKQMGALMQGLVAGVSDCDTKVLM